MKTITEKFLSGIKWNTLEACLYQGILWGFHVILFSKFDRNFYGTVGILFSLLYIGVTLCTLGLDSALSPFIRHYTQSKRSFFSLLGRQFLPNILIYSGLLALVSLYDMNHFFSLFGIPTLDSLFIFLFIMLLIVECVKKTIKTFLGLLFYNQQLATLEITYIILYVTTVAGLYYAHIAMTLYTIFVPVLIYSTIITGFLGALLYDCYCQFPDHAYAIEADLEKRIIRSRIFGYINQLGHIPFSGNMLVPLFAAHLGVSQAAIAKIISTSLQSISSITNKVIGQTSEAALAHAHAYATEEKNSIFALANRYAYSIIFYTLTILCIFNYKTIVAHGFTANLHTNTMLTAFTILLLVEPLFMTYEKKYLVEEKGRYLLYYNLTMLILFGLWIYSNCAYPFLCLLSLTSIRIAWYSILSMQKNTFRYKTPF